jgi:hypothetical protein
MGGACGTYGEKKNACRALSGNLKEIDDLEGTDGNVRIMSRVRKCQ